MSATDCAGCPLRNQPLFRPFTAEQLAFMSKFKSGELTVESGTQILMEGSNAPQLYTVQQGMGLRSKTLENGRRQVINFMLPGDFIGLQAGLLGEMKHSVESSTSMVLCVFKRDDLWTMFRTQPTLAYDITWVSAVEEHFLGETVATLGQRDGTQRIAWAMVKLHQRLRAVGLGRNGEVPLPYRQQDMADALGLSLVHTNKTLRKLADLQLASWQNGLLRINDLDELARVALIESVNVAERPLI